MNDADKHARRAAALRANLRKRKEQARRVDAERSAPASPPPDETA
ncbi:hypothetical protein [Sphingomonas sp.]|nr:hypothetical protein [Sphingomonas sp.]